MRFRRVGLQFWAIVTILWLGAAVMMAGSAYTQASFADQVKLQEQAKDIRAAGGDPALYEWGNAAQVGNFTVPAVQQEAPLFWEAHGKQYAVLGISVPLVLLIVIESIAQLLEGVQALRKGNRRSEQAENAAIG